MLAGDAVKMELSKGGDCDSLVWGVDRGEPTLITPSLVTPSSVWSFVIFLLYYSSSSFIMVVSLLFVRLGFVIFLVLFVY